jgi:hypothetical protein
MIIHSVLDLKKWIATQVGFLIDSDDVYYIYRYIKRKTDHPIFGCDWSKFLETIDCKSILNSK